MIALNWSHFSHLYDGSHSDGGQGVIWYWCVINHCTGEKLKDVPGGHCIIDGQVDDQFQVYGYTKDWKMIFHTTDVHAMEVNGLCKVSGRVIDFDGTPKVQKAITFEMGRDERVITTNSKGEWYMHLVPKKRVFIHLDRDLMKLWVEVPDQSDIDYDDLTEFGYPVPVNPERNQL